MHIVQRVPRRVQRKMYLASERQVVNGEGLGDLEGMFNIGKMFTRMFTFKKHSFDFKNILSAAGSVVLTGATLGLAPKISSQKSKASEFVGGTIVPVAALLPKKLTGMTNTQRTGGYVTLAVGAAVAGGMTLAPMLPSLSTIGSFMSSAGGFLKGGMSLLGGMFGGGSQQQPQQGGMTQAEYDAMQAQAQAQAQYEAQVRAQQAAMYQPGGYAPSIPFIDEQYSGAGQPSMTGMNASYGDLRTPYTAIQEDGTQVQVDPQTGQIVQAGIIPDLSPATWLMLGGTTLVGWYLMSGSKSTN